MDNAHRVLCAIELVDKGPLRDADRIARRLGADLTVLHVIPDGYPGVPMSPAGLAKTLLDQQELSRKIGDHLSEQVGAQTGRSGDEIAIEVEAGVPHELIVQRARALRADVIVLGAGGKSPRLVPMLGSVAAHVARYAQASVLISRTRRVGGHVVAATDFSETAAWAVDAAVAEARTRQAPLLVMHSLDAPMPDVVIGDPGIAPAVTVPAEIIRAALPAATERLSALVAEIPAPVETLVAEEAPSLAITRTAGRLGADLVVVGHAHRSNIGRWVLGSVADAVARDAPCSVLIVKTPLGASTLH